MTRVALLLLTCIFATACGPLASPLLEANGSDSWELNGGCALQGNWLVHVEIPVSWQGTERLQAGHGVVAFEAKAHRAQAGLMLVDQWHLSAVTLPHTASAGGISAWHTRFSRALFVGWPPAPSITQVTEAAPAGRFHMQPTAVQFGAVIPNPIMSPWPANLLDYAVDFDHDNRPGVSVPVMGMLPLDVDGQVFASRLDVALRVVVRTASGDIESCDSMAGLGVVPSLDGQLAVNVSVLGCRTAAGTTCTAAQAAFAAAAQPRYESTGHAKIQMTR